MLIIKRSTHKSATLNQQFYEELLYIMGLEEKNSIIRPNRVQGAIVTQLMDDHDVPEDEAFSLTTTWINRLLFIKLLEGLLRGYLEDKQLDLLQCASFAELKELFFSVLAKPIEERSAANRKRFQHHPYLNSSLFDKTEEEHCHLISILHNDNLQIYRGSTLISGQRNGAKPLLSYLLEFLASYRFSNDQKDSERLISAPVLGLIFEKLNGHRDGAVYTPSAITRRMCEQTIVPSIIDRCNEKYDWSCESWDELVHQFSEHFKEQHPDFKERVIARELAAREIVHGISLCDPAVGSGHFLVSAMNELLLRKVELSGGLCDEEGRYIDNADLVHHADEVLVNHKGHELRYTKAISQAKPDGKSLPPQLIQKAMFREKQGIIEHCLYGADINPTSVKICKLRLWIELLKSAYYDTASQQLHTLPNLETRIVVADSLIPLPKGENSLVNGLDTMMQELQENRQLYFKAHAQSEKEELRNSYNTLRAEIAKLEDLDTFAPKKTREMLAWSPYETSHPCTFFDPDWMFGIKEGFDIIIGNPPYISTKGIDKAYKNTLMGYYGFADDTYSHFFFRALEHGGSDGNFRGLLKEGGILSFITSKSFWTTPTKRNLRDLLLSYQLMEVEDAGNPFDGVTVDTSIVRLKKHTPAQGHRFTFVGKVSEGETQNAEMVFPPIEQTTYSNAPNAVFFTPCEENLSMLQRFGARVNELLEEWWDSIRTSSLIGRHEQELATYRKSLQPGDIALLGLLTDGGQGLATGDNASFLAVRASSNLAEQVKAQRAEKLYSLVRNGTIDLEELQKVLPTHRAFSHIQDFHHFLRSLSESQIAELFENLRQEHGKDTFGQGFIHRLIDDAQLADANRLTQSEKENGIAPQLPHYVPYDKGDREGNRWYAETPYAIDWSEGSVDALKSSKDARYQGAKFYFQEGFCWSDINTFYIKCRRKGRTVNDVKSMSMYAQPGITADPTICDSLDLWTSFYIAVLSNQCFIPRYIKSFISTTETFQINDGRKIPIVIPTPSQLKAVHALVDQAIAIKKGESKANLQKVEEDIEDLIATIYGMKG